MYALVILTATLAPGQPDLEQAVFVGQPPAKAPGKPVNNADARKEARDQVLRSVGPEALAFTKEYGDLGIYSLQQCEPVTGKKLVQLFNNGELSKLKNPKAVLEAVRQYKEPAAVWLVEHHAVLEDPEALEAWCKEPMEYVYDLRSISSAAEELRNSRKRVPSWLTTTTGEWNVPYIIIGALVLVLLASLFWKRKQAASCGCRAGTRMVP